MNKRSIGQFSLAIIAIMLLTGCGKSTKAPNNSLPNGNMDTFNPLNIDNPNKPAANIGSFVKRKSVNGTNITILGLTSFNKSPIEILEVKGPRGYETNFETYVVGNESISELSEKYDILSSYDRSTLRNKMGSQIIVFNLYNEFCQPNLEDSTVRVKYKMRGFVYQTNFEFRDTIVDRNSGISGGISLSYNINSNPMYSNPIIRNCDVRMITR